MNIVVLDGYSLNPGDLSWQDFKDMGHFTVYDRTENKDIIARIKDAEIVLTNKTPLNKKTIESCPKLSYIGVLATGYNVVDVQVATSRNISVTNIPGYGTSAVAQFVFAHLLNIMHGVEDHHQAVQKGQWTASKDFCFWNSPQTELSGKTMGIIGYGRIGQQTGLIAQAFGMKVVAYSRSKDLSKESDTMKYVSLEDLFSLSDIITLHCPLLEDTQGLINRKNIEKMKDKVILINTSRGQLIVEDDLAEALNSGKIRAAGLDVVSEEPISETNPLLRAKNCFITPHIAWAPLESRQRLLKIALDNLQSFLKGEPLNLVDN